VAISAAATGEKAGSAAMKAIIAIVVVVVIGLAFWMWTFKENSADVVAAEGKTGFLLLHIYQENDARKRTGKGYAPSFDQMEIAKSSEFLAIKGKYLILYSRPERDHFSVQAIPAQSMVTGVRTYYVDQTGVVRRETVKPATSSSPPVSLRRPHALVNESSFTATMGFAGRTMCLHNMQLS
jgi:hypothetical protein